MLTISYGSRRAGRSPVRALLKLPPPGPALHFNAGDRPQTCCTDVKQGGYFTSFIQNSLLTTSFFFYSRVHRNSFISVKSGIFVLFSKKRKVSPFELLMLKVTINKAFWGFLIFFSLCHFYSFISR